MCGSKPKAPEPQPAPPPPPPPPAAVPQAPVIEDGGKRRSTNDTQRANRAGTRQFRNDLMIQAPGSAAGVGLSIPG